MSDEKREIPVTKLPTLTVALTGRELHALSVMLGIEHVMHMHLGDDQGTQIIAGLRRKVFAQMRAWWDDHEARERMRLSIEAVRDAQAKSGAEGRAVAGFDDSSRLASHWKIVGERTFRVSKKGAAKKRGAKKRG
jgi:hypothetical protein